MEIIRDNLKLLGDVNKIGESVDSLENNLWEAYNFADSVFRVHPGGPRPKDGVDFQKKIEELYRILVEEIYPIHHELFEIANRNLNNE